MKRVGAIDLPHMLDPRRLTCRAVIETPAESRAKFDYDPESGMFMLAGVLPAGMAFPLDFGFVPSTRGEDGDPVDMLILSEFAQPLPVGCLVDARLIGVIEAEQTQDGETKRNDRLVGRLAKSRSFAEIDTIDQLGASFCEELKTFFATYNDLKDRRFTTLRFAGPDRAARLIEQAAR